MEELQQGAFGPIYTQFESKPKEAMTHLCNVKDGECPKAFYREDESPTTKPLAKVASGYRTSLQTTATLVLLFLFQEKLLSNDLDHDSTCNHRSLSVHMYRYNSLYP